MKNLLPKWGIHFDVAGKERRIEELERKIEEPGFWDNPEESQELMKELKNLKAVSYTHLDVYKRQWCDSGETVEM